MKKAGTVWIVRLQVSLCICQTFLYPFILEGGLLIKFFRKIHTQHSIYIFKSIQVFRGLYYSIETNFQPPDIMTVNNKVLYVYMLHFTTVYPFIHIVICIRTFYINMKSIRSKNPWCVIFNFSADIVTHFIHFMVFVLFFESSVFFFCFL